MKRGAERDLRPVTRTDEILMAILEELVDLRQLLPATPVDPPAKETRKKKRKAKAKG